MSDDYADFCASMRRAGWERYHYLILPGVGNWWVFAPHTYYNSTTGDYRRVMDAKPTYIGTWRDWLAKGQTPPPF